MLHYPDEKVKKLCGHKKVSKSSTSHIIRVFGNKLVERTNKPIKHRIGVEAKLTGVGAHFRLLPLHLEGKAIMVLGVA
jgi:hypothetical protein